DQNALLPLIDYANRELRKRFFNESYFAKVIELLGKLGNPKAISLLIQVVIDKNRKFRKSARWWSRFVSYVGLLAFVGLISIFIIGLFFCIIIQNIFLFIFGGQYSLDLPPIVFYAVSLFAILGYISVLSLYPRNIRIIAAEALG